MKKAANKAQKQEKHRWVGLRESLREAHQIRMRKTVAQTSCMWQQQKMDINL
jgi:hypothetical protein